MRPPKSAMIVVCLMTLHVHASDSLFQQKKNIECHGKSGNWQLIRGRERPRIPGGIGPTRRVIPVSCFNQISKIKVYRTLCINR